MKHLGKIAVCLACGLVLNAGARADDGVLPHNPYAPIVARNVFNLNPPQPETPAEQADPPPKITPNGIMSIFGQLQVLFKVATPAKAGQPAKEDAYILSEGQRQDEIEVVQIDEKDSLVTFNNHGTVQELPLAKANVPAVNTSPGTSPGKPSPGQIPSRFGSRPGGPGWSARNHAPVNNSPAAVASTPGGGVADQAITTAPAQDTAPAQGNLTPEEQAILIAAQTEKYKAEGNPLYQIMPPVPGLTGPRGGK
jgi:hypothetical protein